MMSSEYPPKPPGLRYYDRDGNPISEQRCLELWSAPVEYRRIDFTTLPPGVSISTVWLGLDHSFVGGPPMIFETMVFGGACDGEAERYATEAQARAGHEEWVTRVGKTQAKLIKPEQDVLDDIDALVNEQLEQGMAGYGHDREPQRCPHCGGEWHGLPVNGCPGSTAGLG